MTVKTKLITALALIAGLGVAAAPARADWRSESLQGRFERLQRASAEYPESWRQAAAPTERAELRQDLREQLASLPHEQRQQMRQQMREQWRQPPPADYRDQRRQQGQWQPMPQDDRSRLREELRENRGGGGGRGRREGWR